MIEVEFAMRPTDPSQSSNSSAIANGERGYRGLSPTAAATNLDNACALERGGPGRSHRRQAFRGACKARRAARHHRKGTGGVDGHIGNIGGRPEHRAAVSASVRPRGAVRPLKAITPQKIAAGSTIHTRPLPGGASRIAASAPARRAQSAPRRGPSRLPPVKPHARMPRRSYRQQDRNI